METYTLPTQVLFWNETDRKTVLAGIAYKDEIICADCGGIFRLSECKILQELLEWRDLSEYIE